jgi:hypothetical protein
MWQVFFENVTDEWLVSRKASRLFGAAAMAIALLTPLFLGWVTSEGPGLVRSIYWGILGIAGGLGVFFLWEGMWRYWIRCDPSPRWARRIWFLVLIVGVWWGAVLYYLLVYLRKTPVIATPPSVGTAALKVFRRILVASWVLMAIGFTVLFAFPRATFARVYPWVPALIVAVLLITSAVYNLARTYSAGMRRSANT